MPLPLVIAATVIGLVTGTIAIAEVMWKPIRRYLLKRRDQAPATADQIAEIQRMISELQQTLLAPPEGAAPTETKALAAEATKKTESLLNEALQLQRQHKEREAIDCLLEAYRRDLPPIAKAQLHSLAGNGFFRLAQLEEAEGHYREALAAAEEAGHQQGQAAALGSLGIVYGQRGELHRAEKHLQKALAIQQEIGDSLGQANSLGNLGIVYAERGDLDRAEKHLQKALAIHEDIGYRYGQAQDLGNLGNIYFLRGDLDKAEEHHKKALAIHEDIENRLGQAQDLGNLGNVYLLRGDLDRAEEHHKKSFAIKGEISDRLGQANSLGNLATLYRERGMADKALQYYRDALKLFEEIGAEPEVTKTKQLIQQLEAQG